MVKFGRHLQFYLESDELQQSDGANEDPYIVPYTDIRECIGHSQQHFVAEWTSSLNQASEDYNKRLKLLWKRIFDDLVNASSSMTHRRQQQHMPFSSQIQIDTLDDSSKFEKEYRGLPNDRAVQIYMATIDERQSRELFAYIKKLHSTAAMNGEALRKLVKKFDKGASARGDDLLTATLFPELYSACFMAYQSLETYIEIMRDSLVVSEGEEEEEDILDDDEDNQYDFQQRFQKEGVVVRRRADELSWLHNTISTISCLPFNLLSSLVAHRGFHCPRDGSDKRPMENSLAAYESAWSSGIHLCECDVALTKDEKLVLAHDDDFSRLALDPNSSSSKKKVSDLTMKEIISLTFKSGTRPPLLLDVLRSAQAIGDESKLIIEIKPGNPEACTALVRLFRSHPDLIERCAAVMSFDAWSMHKLRIELDELALTFKTYGSPSPPKAALLRGSPPERVTGSPHNLNAMQLRKSFEVKMPQILLLTVAKEPQMHYELWVDVSDLSPIHSWLRNENSSSLDGVYLQYQSEMLEQNGIMAMRKLSAMYRVGVWGEFGSDPDDCITALKLISECGVSYVNTDLPRGFVSNNAKQYFGLY